MNKEKLGEALIDALGDDVFDRVEELRAILDAHDYFKTTNHIEQVVDLVVELVDDVVDIWIDKKEEIIAELYRKKKGLR